MNRFVSKQIVVLFKWPEEILIRVGVTSTHMLVARVVVVSLSKTQRIVAKIFKQKLKFFPVINLLKKKRNLLYIRNQFLPRSKYFPPRL
jgi:hypothetical protein